MKSLGTINMTSIHIENFSGSKASFDLVIGQCQDKKVRVQIDLWQIKQIMDCIHDVIRRYRVFGLQVFNTYYDLRDKTGCPKIEGDSK